MIRDLVRYGDPRLLAENLEANASSPDFASILGDMIDTCHAAPGIGLASPQIGINLRLAIIDLSVGADPDGLRVRAGDASGRVREIEGAGLLARALSHEIDHLNGLLFVHRLKGLKRELTWKKIERHRRKAGW